MVALAEKFSREAYTPQNRTARNSYRPKNAYSRNFLQPKNRGPARKNRVFSSKYLDDSTGWYYYGYRYYLPELGRWPSRDPVEEAGGWNLYAAHWNSPTIFFDPLGETSIALPVCGKILIGTTAPAWGPWVLIGTTIGYGGYVIYEYVRTGTFEEHWQWWRERLCKCEKAEIQVVPQTITQTKTKTKKKRKRCKNGTWKVGHCLRNGPVSAFPACWKSPYAIGPTKQAAKAASLAGLPASCWGSGVSYHHCNTFVCQSGTWMPTFW
jgi:RHS repeat-associated protein